MALRSARVLREAAGKSESVLSGEGGLRGLMQRLRERISSGKLLRPDLSEDVLRIPVAQAQFRHPAPAEQEPAVVPQGPYKNVFDITYHARDSRRRNKKEELDVSDIAKDGLPPTAGVPHSHVFLGMAGDFDRAK